MYDIDNERLGTLTEEEHYDAGEMPELAPMDTEEPQERFIVARTKAKAMSELLNRYSRAVCTDPDAAVAIARRYDADDGATGYWRVFRAVVVPYSGVPK